MQKSDLFYTIERLDLEFHFEIKSRMAPLLDSLIESNKPLQDNEQDSGLVALNMGPSTLATSTESFANLIKAYTSLFYGEWYSMILAQVSITQIVYRRGHFHTGLTGHLCLPGGCGLPLDLQTARPPTRPQS